MIDHQKVIESMNVTFDDTKLPSLQREKEFESLEFENLPDYYLRDEDELVVISGVGKSNAHVEIDPSRGSVGNNTQSQMSTQSFAESANQGGGSLSHNNNNSGEQMNQDLLVILTRTLNKVSHQDRICQGKWYGTEIIPFT